MNQVKIEETELAKHYEICEIISNGEFSNVYLVRKLKQKYRLKTIAKVYANAKNCDELMFLSHFNHPNIVQIVDRFKHYYYTDLRERQVLGCLIMEKCEFRLETLLSNEFDKLPKFAIKSIIYQILNGLNYMHRMSLMHRDLNPANILVGENLSIKIASFRFVTFIRDNQYLAADAGQMAYRAPEMLRGSTVYTNSIDLWSIGCLMVEMFVHKMLFAGCDSPQEQLHLIDYFVRRSREPKFHEFILYNLNLSSKTTKLDEILMETTECSARGLKLINRLLTVDGKKRISAFDALNDDYFKKIHKQFNS